MSLTYTPTNPDLGAECPEFSLPATDGKTYSRSDLNGHDASLVMFICNHCPYVKAIEDRLVALVSEFKNISGERKSFAAVAISSNDPDYREEDSFPHMVKKAKEKSYPFPYLFDETQKVARDFGAVCTPDFFLYDRHMRLAYRGRLDDSWKDESQVKSRELHSAISALISGRLPSEKQNPSMGCNIKWRAQS